MIEYTQWIAIITTLINAAIAIIDKKLINFFKAKGAKTPESALRFESIPPVLRWRLKRLRYAAFESGNDESSWYFNENAYKSKRKARRIRAFIFIAIILLVILTYLEL